MTTTPRVGARIRDAAVDPQPELPAGRGYTGTVAGVTFEDGNPAGGQITQAVHRYAGHRDDLDIVDGRLVIITALVADHGLPENAGREGPEGNPHGTEMVWPGIDRAEPYELHPEAPHERWVDLAVARGLDRATAEAMTREELVAAYGDAEAP